LIDRKWPCRCAFYKNDYDVVGSDLYVMDNIASYEGGSYVSCNGKLIFLVLVLEMGQVENVFQDKRVFSLY
jgi:hypothetical protein